MAQPDIGQVEYRIDPKVSQFTVQAFADGIISAVAHSPKIAIRDWTGETRFKPDGIRQVYLLIKGKTASLEVLDELRESDRQQLHRTMNQEVLESARFPEFTFECTSVEAEKQKDSLYRMRLAGQLTLHGITNDHAFTAHVAFGVDSLRAYGEFTVRQTDYGLKIASIAGGTLKLQNDLKCSFYVIGKKQ
jgi:polyisoprenoid-binding protein YceI